MVCIVPSAVCSAVVCVRYIVETPGLGILLDELEVSYEGRHLSFVALLDYYKCSTRSLRYFFIFFMRLSEKTNKSLA